jgi:xylan 1,4-beta-xylosidase
LAPAPPLQTLPVLNHARQLARTLTQHTVFIAAVVCVAILSQHPLSPCIDHKFLLYDIVQCDGQVEMMSYWTFDDVFEEGGVPEDPFHNGFGLIAVGGIKKPAFYDYALLHLLGSERLANTANNVLVTRRSDGTLVIAAWNQVAPDQKGTPQHFRLEFKNVNASGTVLISRVDEKHSNSLAAYRAMGSPRYPTQAQIEQLNRESALAPPEATTLKNGALELDVPVNGLVLLEIPRW